MNLVFKKCTACNLLKGINEFSSQKLGRLGKRSICKVCERIRSKEYRAKNPEKIKAYASGVGLEKIKINQRKYRLSHKDSERARSAKFKVDYPEKIKEYAYNNAKQNRSRKNSIEANRRSSKRQAVPKWADLEAISSLYRLSMLEEKLTGVKHNVDHIVPLVSKLVCGLHVEYNLRVISEKDNKIKSNKIWPDMP